MSLHLRRWQHTAAMLPGLVRRHQLVAESNDERLAAQSGKRSITRKQRCIAVERERPPRPPPPLIYLSARSLTGGTVWVI